jgi:hypothetical protein
MLRHALEAAGDDVLAIARDEPNLKGLGSTGSLLSLHKGLYFIAQVGDSRVYRVRDGEIVQLTRDHSFVQQLYDDGVITADKIESHPQRHVLTRSLGSSERSKVDTFQDRVLEGDFFLICSDGLTGYADPDAVTQILKDRSLGPSTRADQLITAALEGGGGDNVSVIIVRVDALEPDDDWAVERAELPVSVLETDGPTPPPIPDPAIPAASRRFPLLIVFAALVALALAITLRPRPLHVSLRLSGMDEGEEATVRVEDIDGNEIHAGLSLEEAGAVTLHLPEAGEYRISVDAPGFVPVSGGRFRIDRGDELIELPMRRSGRWLLTFDDPGSLARLSLTRLPEAEEPEVIYSWELGEKAHRTEFDLLPDVLHRLTVEATSGRTFEYHVELKSGEKEPVSIRLTQPQAPPS